MVDSSDPSPQAQPRRGRRVRNEVAAVARGSTPTHLHLRERLGVIGIATLGVDLIAAVLVYFFDRHAAGTEIHNFGDSLFWTTCQLLTVSSQLKNPISTGARIVDVVIEAWSITVIATLAGSFGAFFNRRGFERHPPDWAMPATQQGGPGESGTGEAG